MIRIKQCVDYFLFLALALRYSGNICHLVEMDFSS